MQAGKENIATALGLHAAGHVVGKATATAKALVTGKDKPGAGPPPAATTDGSQKPAQPPTPTQQSTVPGEPAPSSSGTTPPISIETTGTPSESRSGQQPSTTVNDGQPPQTPSSGPPSSTSLAPPAAKPTTPPQSLEQSQKLIHNVMNLPPEERGHPKTQANVAQARTVVQEHVKKLEDQTGPPSAAQTQKLADAKAALERLEPPEGAASPTHSSGGGQSQGSTATSHGDTPPTGHVTSTHNFDGGTDGTSGGSHTSDGVTPPGGSPGSTGSSRTDGTSAPPQIGHGRLIPENNTSPEHIDLARRRAANLREAAAAGKLNPHEQSVYDNARRVLDRNAPAQGGTRAGSPPQGSRDKGNPDHLALSGDEDALVSVTPGGEDATIDAAADTPPALVPVAAPAVGTRADGPDTPANPDAPTASVGGPTPAPIVPLPPPLPASESSSPASNSTPPASNQGGIPAIISGGGTGDGTKPSPKESTTPAELPRSPQTGLDELKSLPPMLGKTKAEIEAELTARGYTSTPANSGGTVWTKPGIDGTTSGVRIDPAKIRTRPRGYADEVPHVHKETVPTSSVDASGNYLMKDATTHDDAGNPNADKRDTHISGGH
jgi:hypothetical protein